MELTTPAHERLFQASDIYVSLKYDAIESYALSGRMKRIDWCDISAT